MYNGNYLYDPPSNVEDFPPGTFWDKKNMAKNCFDGKERQPSLYGNLKGQGKKETWKPKKEKLTEMIRELQPGEEIYFTDGVPHILGKNAMRPFK